jgi:serine/threonine protein kinase
VLPPAFSADLDRLERFEQEARAAEALSHPNILTIHDFGRDAATSYVVSELLAGRTLREELSEGPPSVGRSIEYGLQVANGLVAAHEKRIVHRDLKPENIFITLDARVKILDFGLAKLTEHPPLGKVGQSGVATERVDTSPAMIFGTIGYMSPEQIRGQSVDVRSDIFSFGAVLHEMLSGARAFSGESAIEALNAILKEDAPRLPVVERGIPAPLVSIVTRCLAKSPDDRFQSAADLVVALQQLTVR